MRSPPFVLHRTPGLLKLIGALILLLFVSNQQIRAETTSDGQDVDGFVARMISSYDVAVFAKSYCPYCVHTEKLIREIEGSHYKNDLSIRFVFLDKMLEDDGPLIQMELLTKTGQKTVPNIFIGGEHIGGDSDLTKMYNLGDLHKKLNLIVEAKTKVQK